MDVFARPPHPPEEGDGNSSVEVFLDFIRWKGGLGIDLGEIREARARGFIGSELQWIRSLRGRWIVRKWVSRETRVYEHGW